MVLFCFSLVYAQDATEIVTKMNDNVTGLSSQSISKMTIVRPDWTREVEMKTWSKGDEYYLIYITSPARDQGQVFLKRDLELWNWMPSIGRMIKLPPSMMMQSWMGSDFTNDDLVRESSVVIDYTHILLGEEELEGYNCYKIELTPKPEAPVVWGKVISWISKDELLQLKTEFYDEEGYLVNTMLGKEVKMIGGRLLPTRLEMIPAEEEGKMTVVEQLDLVFDQPIDESFFSIQNMKRVR